MIYRLQSCYNRMPVLDNQGINQRKLLAAKRATDTEPIQISWCGCKSQTNCVKLRRFCNVSLSKSQLVGRTQSLVVSAYWCCRVRNTAGRESRSPSCSSQGQGRIRTFIGWLVSCERLALLGYIRLGRTRRTTGEWPPGCVRVTRESLGVTRK